MSHRTYLVDDGKKERGGRGIPRSTMHHFFFNVFVALHRVLVIRIYAVDDRLSGSELHLISMGRLNVSLYMICMCVIVYGETS